MATNGKNEVLCNDGCSPSANEIKNLVQDYVQANNLKTPFTEDHPWEPLIQQSFTKTKIKYKKVTMFSDACKTTTVNPFIIYEFYNVIDKVITDNKFKANRISNCYDAF